MWLIQGDLGEMCHGIPNNSVKMVVANPPYDIAGQTYYQYIREVAEHVLEPRGCL
jgi:tRNA1(Val) A37 N6-methylase TrmN6